MWYDVQLIQDHSGGIQEQRVGSTPSPGFYQSQTGSPSALLHGSPPEAVAIAVTYPLDTRTNLTYLGGHNG